MSRQSATTPRSDGDTQLVEGPDQWEEVAAEQFDARRARRPDTLATQKREVAKGKRGKSKPKPPSRDRYRRHPAVFYLGHRIWVPTGRNIDGQWSAKYRVEAVVTDEALAVALLEIVISNGVPGYMTGPKVKREELEARSMEAKVAGFGPQGEVIG